MSHSSESTLNTYSIEEIIQHFIFLTWLLTLTDKFSFRKLEYYIWLIKKGYFTPKIPGCFDSALQVICIVPFDNTPLILHEVQVRCFWAMSMNPCCMNQYLCPNGQVPSPAGKYNLRLHKACQQNEAWSALKCCGGCLQIITDCGNFSLDFK